MGQQFHYAAASGDGAVARAIRKALKFFGIRPDGAVAGTQGQPAERERGITMASTGTPEGRDVARSLLRLRREYGDAGRGPSTAWDEQRRQ